MEVEINGRSHRIDVEPDTPLLWVLRDHLGMMGTKFGCGVGLCGACTVLLGGVAVRACVTPVAAAAADRVTTIEGISEKGLHPAQRAWIAEQAPQCGYCQSGMIMAAVALLEANPNPSDADIDSSVTNLCSCGSYPRVRRAIHRAALERSGEPAPVAAPGRSRSGGDSQP